VPATDNHANSSAGLESSAENIAAITPHDSNELANVSRGIYVGVGGDVKVTTRGGTTETFKNAAAGSVLPVRAKLVFATGTTATNLLNLY